MGTSPSAAAGDDGAPVLSRSASTTVATVVKGSHVHNIDGYSRIKEMIDTCSCTYSCTFEVGGHTWRIQYYPNGSKEHYADYISVYLDHVSPAEGVNAEFQIALLDGGGGKAVPSHRRASKHTFNKDVSRWGWRRFIKREELEKSDHIKNDRLTIRCDVTVLKELCVEELAVEESFVEVPPSNMHRHLGDLLVTQEGADVTFKVGEETFAAHRYVLAARSPVFKAELFGSMREKTARSICINDMDANLLVAADRYEMERLKLICEDKLCKCLEVKTAATTLAFAEQHHCHGLKKGIFKFLGLPWNMKAVMATDGYEHLMTSCPSICKELMAKFVDLCI